jgi:hypothetical protein
MNSKTYLTMIQSTTNHTLIRRVILNFRKKAIKHSILSLCSSKALLERDRHEFSFSTPEDISTLIVILGNITANINTVPNCERGINKAYSILTLIDSSNMSSDFKEYHKVLFRDIIKGIAGVLTIKQVSDL